VGAVSRLNCVQSGCQTEKDTESPVRIGAQSTETPRSRDEHQPHGACRLCPRRAVHQRLDHPAVPAPQFRDKNPCAT
jgi:hypothetical protein